MNYVYTQCTMKKTVLVFCMCRFLYARTLGRIVQGLVAALFLTRAVKCASNFSDHLKSDLTEEKLWFA